MGLLSPGAPDPKRRIGAYLALGERDMYEVVEVCEDGTVKAQNLKTGLCYTMTVTNLKRSRLVQPTPDEEMADWEARIEECPSIPDPTPVPEPSAVREDSRLRADGSLGG